MTKVRNKNAKKKHFFVITEKKLLLIVNDYVLL